MYYALHFFLFRITGLNKFCLSTLYAHFFFVFSVSGWTIYIISCPIGNQGDTNTREYRALTPTNDTSAGTSFLQEGVYCIITPHTYTYTYIYLTLLFAFLIKAPPTCACCFVTSGGIVRKRKWLRCLDENKYMHIYRYIIFFFFKK